MTTVGWGLRMTHLCSFKMQRRLSIRGTNCAVLGCNTLLWDDALGGHIYAIYGCKVLLIDEVLGGHFYIVLGCKADWTTKGQNCAVSRDSGFWLREGLMFVLCGWMFCRFFPMEVLLSAVVFPDFFCVSCFGVAGGSAFLISNLIFSSSSQV